MKLKKYSFLKWVVVCFLCLAVQEAGECFFQENQEYLQIGNTTEVFSKALSVGGFIGESTFSVPAWECGVLPSFRFSQLNRSYVSKFVRSAGTLFKRGREVGQYAVLYRLVSERFHSGFSENHHRFISLGKLII